ncbi:MAG: chemotaxis protein CheW [Leptospiraceae bacterium]|nr:chemotaxis protein CheW [Leptospiraceae bacterium]MCP5496963.1 chemotaxis protein CheW [Leptospiraceae bacterium]
MVDYEKLMLNFISEADNLLEDTERSILQLENNYDPKMINDIFRSIHTLKGNSGIFDLPNIKNLSHSMESLLNQMRTKQAEIQTDVIDLFLTSIDRLKQMIKDIKNSNSYNIVDLTEKLDKHTNSFKKEPNSGLNSHQSNQVETTKVLQSTENSKKQKIKISIPENFVAKAKENRYFLAVAKLDMSQQKEKYLSEISSKISKINATGNILAHGVMEEKLLLSLENENLCKFPYYFVSLTQGEPSEFFQKHEIKVQSIKIIYNPTANDEENIVEPQPESGPSEVEKQKIENINNELKEKNQESISLGEHSKETHLKVPLNLIDGLINLAGEAVIARNELLQKIDTIKEANLAVSGKKISYLISKLQEGIMKTRLQELNLVFQRLPRLIRDVCHSTGKKVELIIEGGEIELDKTLIDAIIDPIMHMIRNCIDHGIESPNERIKLRKPESGTIRVNGSLRGGNVIISIKDDGKGLDVEKIKTKAVNNGLMTKESLETLSTEEIYDLIFLPGFSTAEKVTTTSGRGVGMDVIRTNMKKVGGSAEISSEIGKSTTLTMTIPQTLSIVTCLLIKSCGKRFALPQANMKELILINKENLSVVEGHKVYKLRGHLLPLIDLANFLELKGHETYKPTYIAVVKSEKHYFGLLIEEIINPEEIVVKSLGSLFAGLNLFSGAAIMGDGEAVLILDVPGIAKFANMQSNMILEKGKVTADESENSITQVDQGFLLFEVGKQSFAIEVTSIPRIEKIYSKDIELFMDFETINYRDVVVPLVRLEKVYKFDYNHKKDLYYVIIFKFNGIRTGILATEVFNVINNIPELDHDTFSGDSIKGHAIINGRVTLFLDIEDLVNRVHQEQFVELSRHLEEEEEDEKSEPKHSFQIPEIDSVIKSGYEKLTAKEDLVEAGV